MGVYAYNDAEHQDDSSANKLFMKIGLFWENVGLFLIWFDSYTLHLRMGVYAYIDEEYQDDSLQIKCV